MITQLTVPGNRRKVGIWDAYSRASIKNLYVLPHGTTMNHQLHLEVLESDILLFLKKETSAKTFR